MPENTQTQGRQHNAPGPVASDPAVDAPPPKKLVRTFAMDYIPGRDYSRKRKASEPEASDPAVHAPRKKLARTFAMDYIPGRDYAQSQSQDQKRKVSEPEASDPVSNPPRRWLRRTLSMHYIPGRASLGTSKAPATRDRMSEYFLCGFQQCGC